MCFLLQEASDAIIRLDRDDEAYVSMLSQPWLPGNKLNPEIHLVHDRTIMDKGSACLFVLPCRRIGPTGGRSRMDDARTSSAMRAACRASPPYFAHTGVGRSCSRFQIA